MIELLQCVYFGAFYVNSRYETFDFVLAILGNLLAWAITIWLAVVCLDYIFKTNHVDTFTVLSKSHTPAYVSTSIVMSGNTAIPVTTAHPASWGISFDKDLSCSVTKQYFNEINVGDSYKVEYYTGLTSFKYCVNINIIRR